MNKILIITNSSDIHVTKFQNVLANEKVIRIDTDKINKSCYIEYTNGDISIVHGGLKLQTENIISIWYRKPKNWNYYSLSSAKGTDMLAREYRLNEINYLTLSYFHSIRSSSIFILNDPLYVRSASYKPNQLACAKSVGFNVPNTLISFDKEKIINFISTYNNEVIMKPISSSVIRFGKHVKVLPVVEVNTQSFLNIPDNINYPVFLQKRVDKLIELRVTVIGNNIFACSIDSQCNTQTIVDWHRGDVLKLSHKVIELPEDIKNKCFELCRHFNLQFGAFDFIIDKNGDYVFVEINPNGQYLWIEDLTKLPLTEAIANLLQYPDKNKLI